MLTLGAYAAKPTKCPEEIRKDHAPEYRKVEKDPLPSGVVARMESGNEFEKQIGESWEAALGSSFKRIAECDRSGESKKSREQATAKLMASPGKVRVIWNARLPVQARTRRAGEPDALIWAGKEDGTHRWVPVDVKDHKVLEGTRKPTLHEVSELHSPLPAQATLKDLGRGSLKMDNAFQLAHYRRMLEEMGHGHSSARGGIIGRERMIVWHDLEAPVKHEDEELTLTQRYDRMFAERVAIALEAKRGDSTPAPEWKAQCPSCAWRTTCNDELTVDLDHITLLPGITPERAKAHYKAGVTRRGQLARLDMRAAELVDEGVDLQSLVTWAKFADEATSVSLWPGVDNRSRAALRAAGVGTSTEALELDPKVVRYSGSKVWNLAASVDQARVQLAGKVYRNRGVESVSVQRAAYEQDIDIEDADGFVYLIGVRTTGYKRVGEDVRRRTEYRPFVTWDRTPESEAANFAAFWEHVTSSQTYAKSNRYGYVAYYYGHHEPSMFRKLAERHQDEPGVPTVEEVERFFDLKNVVNLHRILKEELVWPTPTLGLKDIAKWVRFTWRDEDPSGDNSMAWYKSAVESEEEEERDAMRTRLIQYNADDTAAQQAVREWLIRLGEVRKPGTKLASVAELEKRFNRSRAR